MLSVSRLLTGSVTAGDALRYERRSQAMPPHLLHYSADKRPIVVWNLTRRCNLHCAHCYADARGSADVDELTTDEGERLLGQLAAFGVPVVLFSGGEPMMRDDLFQLAATARQLGMRAVLSTNGTLIDAAAASAIREIGFSYVGVSLDGLEPAHDKLRGKAGAFVSTLDGLRRLREAGVRTGLRFAAHRGNADQIDAMFDLIEDEDIPRCCVYHLAYAGRGSRIRGLALDSLETRALMTRIFERTLDFHHRGIEKEILTVDNHADAPFLYFYLRERQPDRAAETLQLLRWNGGNQSGVAIASIDPHGEVHADQFSWDYTFGNVRARHFGEIWTDRSHPRMAVLKDRASSLPPRCRTCQWTGICNGNLRARAEAATGDFLGMDPACYLTDAEIADAGAGEMATGREN